MSAVTQDDRKSGVITAGDPDYDSRRRTFNAMVDRRPLEIHACAGVEDVVIVDGRDGAALVAAATSERPMAATRLVRAA